MQHIQIWWVFGDAWLRPAVLQTLGAEAFEVRFTLTQNLGCLFAAGLREA